MAAITVIRKEPQCSTITSTADYLCRGRVWRGAHGRDLVREQHHEPPALRAGGAARENRLVKTARNGGREASNVPYYIVHSMAEYSVLLASSYSVLL